MKNISCTVIIPTYNCSKTINRAVQSVLNQSVLPEKIIIIDDCSNEKELIDYLNELDKNPLIQVIFKKRIWVQEPLEMKG